MTDVRGDSLNCRCSYILFVYPYRTVVTVGLPPCLLVIFHDILTYSHLLLFLRDPWWFSGGILAQEGRLLASLQHPFVVRYRDSFCEACWAVATELLREKLSGLASHSSAFHSRPGWCAVFDHGLLWRPGRNATGHEVFHGLSCSFTSSCHGQIWILVPCRWSSPNGG